MYSNRSSISMLHIPCALQEASAGPGLHLSKGPESLDTLFGPSQCHRLTSPPAPTLSERKRVPRQTRQPLGARLFFQTQPPPLVPYAAAGNTYLASNSRELPK